MITLKEKELECKLEIIDGSGESRTIKIDLENLYILRNKIDKVLLKFKKNE